MSATAGNTAVNRDIERTSADVSGSLPAGKAILAENGLDLAEMGILALVAALDFFAVGEED